MLLYLEKKVSESITARKRERKKNQSEATEHNLNAIAIPVFVLHGFVHNSFLCVFLFSLPFPRLAGALYMRLSLVV